MSKRVVAIAEVPVGQGGRRGCFHKSYGCVRRPSGAKT